MAFSNKAKTRMVCGLALLITVSAAMITGSCKTRHAGLRSSGGEQRFRSLTGGVCSTSGQFTQQALENAKVVRDRIESFMNNPACTAATRAIADLPTTQNGNDAEAGGMGLFAMSQEVQALRRVQSGGAAYANMGVRPDQVTALLNQRLFQMIGVEQSPIPDGDDKSPGMMRVRNDVTLALNHKQRLLRTAGAAIDSVGALFDGLAASTGCPINQPGILGPVVMGSVKILGAYAGADPGMAAKVSGALQKFMNYTRTEYFRNALASLDQVELGLTISCLIETTANGYCAVRDNVALQSDVLNSDPSVIANMRGYVLFSRELPILTKWLILLKSSQPTRVPGIIADQIANMTTPMIVQQKRFEIASKIEYVRYNLDRDPRSARASVYQLAGSISEILMGPVAQGVPSFFDMRYNPKFRTFTLLGLNPPADVTRTTTPLDPDQYFQINNFEPVGDPLTALSTIQAKVYEMFATVSGQVSTYLSRNSNQDAPGVIASFEQAPSVNLPSPRKVFVNIQNYMLDVLQGINDDAKIDPSVAVSSGPIKVILVDTIKKIDRILEASDAVRAGNPDLDREADELLRRQRRTNLTLAGEGTAAPTLSDADRRMEAMTTPLGGAGTSVADASKVFDNEEQSLQGAIRNDNALESVFAKFRQLGAVVVTELDMDTQLDMMITSRVARVLQYDMQRMMRKTMATGAGNQMSPVTKALLMVSNDLMADRFLSVFNGDPQRMRIDLASAQTVNMTTLEAIGSAPAGRVNQYGSTNPIVNTFMRSIGVLAARTDGRATTPQQISAYIANTLNAGGTTDAFFRGLWENVTEGEFAKFASTALTLRLNPLAHFKNIQQQQRVVDRLAGSDAILAGSETTAATQAFGRWMRPDLYWIPSYWSGNQLFSDSPEGAMATLRATYCMQTLSLPDPRPFQPFCKGAVLYSIFEKPEDVDARRGSSIRMSQNGVAELTGLSLIYDDWFRAYEMNEQNRASSGGRRVNYFQSQRVCALHDHLRANEIYSLTRPLRDADILARMNGGGGRGQ